MCAHAHEGQGASALRIGLKRPRTNPRGLRLPGEPGGAAGFRRDRQRFAACVLYVVGHTGARQATA